MCKRLFCPFIQLFILVFVMPYLSLCLILSVLICACQTNVRIKKSGIFVLPDMTKIVQIKMKAS